MVSGWEDFYAMQPPPQDLEQNEDALKEFTKNHFENGNKVVLVTVSFGVSVLQPFLSQYFDSYFL